MNKLDNAFIDSQKLRLMALRDSLRSDVRDKQVEQAQVNAEASGAAIEYEDEAQRLSALELSGNLVVRDAARIALIERALAKIEEGTYGLSDASGKPIPVERLEAVPEAIYTVQEQKSLEKKTPAA
jgi:DnaK suppressor protein